MKRGMRSSDATTYMNRKVKEKKNGGNRGRERNSPGGPATHGGARSTATHGVRAAHGVALTNGGWWVAGGSAARAVAMWPIETNRGSKWELEEVDAADGEVRPAGIGKVPPYPARRGLCGASSCEHQEMERGGRWTE